MKTHVAMESFDMHIVSSMEKIFPKSGCLNCEELNKFSALKGETISFQIAYRYSEGRKPEQTEPDLFAAKNPSVTVEVKSPISDMVLIRKVGTVPVMYPAYVAADDNYITTEPGLFPDILEALNGSFQCIPFQWRSLWVDIDVPADAVAGSFELELIFKTASGQIAKVLKPAIEIIDAVLPKQELIHTEWFYCDCLADYYNVEVFSEKHWTIIENYMATAAKRSVNMILTPIFTPPLDTLIGAERTTTQLVDVALDNGVYSFGFNRLKRWVDTACKAGIEYFEMAHLFSQWGAKYAPKIIVNVNGELKRLFGWHTAASDDSYREFLDAFLPALTAKLEEWGIGNRTVFHISDEPVDANLDTYQAAKEIVKKHLENYKIIDALSHVEFYKQGIIKHPVPSNDTIHDFIDAGAKGLWVYYCCAQCINVSNRFMAMPSARNRILGVQLYKYDLEGFLHWGYNFYNTEYSREKLDPYRVTDAGDAFPSGDSFLVYPGEDGKAVESLRIMVLAEAISDLRALKLLESMTSKEYVMSLIEDETTGPLTFYSYPKSQSYLLKLRRQVNNKIKEIVSQK
jgi:hypothetical protein